MHLLMWPDRKVLPIVRLAGDSGSDEGTEGSVWFLKPETSSGTLCPAEAEGSSHPELRSQTSRVRSKLMVDIVMVIRV